MSDPRSSPRPSALRAGPARRPPAASRTTASVSVSIADDEATPLPAFTSSVRAFEEELDFIYRSLRRHGLTGADTEDVAQDVFVVMLRRWRDFDQKRALRPWLAGITYRAALYHRRRARRELPSGFVDLEDPGTGLDEHVAAERARALVAAALDSLKEKQRLVFVLHELEGLPMQTLSRELGQPLQTLYSRLKSAHRAFGVAVRRLQRSGPMALLPMSALLTHGRQRWPAPSALQRRAQAEVIAGRSVRTTRTMFGLGRRLLMAGLAAVAAVAVTMAVRGHRPAIAPDATIVAAPVAAGSGRVAAATGAGRPGVRRPVTLTSALPPPATAPSDLGRALVGYWRFDDPGEGSSVRDLSGNGTDCVLRRLEPLGVALPAELHAVPGAVSIEGPLGAALSFDGTRWLDCPDPQFQAALSTQLTVALWVRPAVQENGYHALVTRQVGDANRDHFFFGMEGQRLFANSHVWGGRLWGPPLAPGRWTHVALVHDDVVTRLFVDGVPVAQAKAFKRRTVDARTALEIGAGINGPDPRAATQQYSGAVDELLVYERALGDDEVAALATGTQPPLSR